MHPLYDLNLTLSRPRSKQLPETCYGADGVDYTEEARAQLDEIVKNGWHKMPVCMAKTPTSLSDQDKLYGAPKGFRITVREFRPSLGAGFIVALTGKVLTMPGLPEKDRLRSTWILTKTDRSADCSDPSAIWQIRVFTI